MVEQHDVIGEPVGLFEILRGQQQRGAVGHEIAQHLPEVFATARVEPGGRLVEHQHTRLGHDTRGEIEPPPHAARIRLHELAGRLGELEPFEQLVGPGAGDLARQMVEATDQLEVEPAAEIRVDGRLLRGDPDPAADLVGLAATSKPATQAWPSVGIDRVVSMRIAVVLPAPLWPSRPSTVPGATSRSSPRSAQRSPNRLPSPSPGSPMRRGGRRRVEHIRMAYFFFVHSTNSVSSTLYEWQVMIPDSRHTPRPGTTARPASQKAARKVEQVAERARCEGRQGVGRTRPQVSTARRPHGPIAAHDVWTRPEPGARRTKFTREEIAAAAVKIADEEGFDALSMRRLAAELDAGTMTLYHYIRTKDELLAIVNDSVMGELHRSRRRAPDRLARGDLGDRPPVPRRDTPPSLDARHP